MSCAEVFLAKLCERDITVHYKPLKNNLAGAYSASQNTVYIDTSLSACEERCTLAHEYVHAVRGHTGAQPDYVEARVDEEAARLLIDVEEYRQAERVYGSHPNVLAEELDVTPRYVIAFQRTLAI